MNNLRAYGRWASAEFREVCQNQTDFEAIVEAEFTEIVDQAIRQPPEVA